MAAAEERFLSTEEVAERLQVDEQTVRRWIKSGKLEAVKPGREWRIPPTAFEALLESYSSPKAQSSSLVTAAEDKTSEERRRGELANEAGVPEDPATAAMLIDGVIGHAAKLSAGWNQEVKLYAQQGRAAPSYRTFEMSCAVTVLYQQYFGAIEVLQRDAARQGLDPDVATWGPQSKQRLIDSGAAVRALAELYDLIARSSTEDEEGRRNLQARREEFDAGLPALLTEDPAWTEAVEKSRATAELA